MLRIIYLLIGVTFLSGCKPQEAASAEVDFENLFSIHTIAIPVEEGKNLLVFEHWHDDRWHVMHSNKIPLEFRDGVFPFYWMMGLSSETEVIYGLRNFRGGYRLPSGAGKLELHDLTKDAEGRYILFCRTGGHPCVRVALTTSKANNAE